jgi:hypothetical protein
LQIETRWRVEDLQVVQELTPAEDKRSVLLWWRDKGNVKNRVLRLWSLGSQPREPIEVVVEEGKSEAEIERSLTDFPYGLYRLELTILDPWAEAPPATPPGPYGGNVFDLEVREDGITKLDSPVRHIEALLKNITTGVAISELTLDPQTLQVFASQPEQTGRFCRALYIREEKYGDSLALLQQALQQCGEGEVSLSESLARFLIEEGRLEAENMALLFATLFVNLGFLSRPWGPNVKQFLLSNRGDDFSENAEDRSHEAQEEITALYGQATWQSLDAARRFLQRLRSLSGELVYKDQALLKLEGIVTQHGEELLRWWCGEKREKGRKTPSWMSIPLKEAGKVLPRHLRLAGVLCLTATLQRARASEVLHLPAHLVERVNSWGSFFYHTREQEYKRELRWAEETFAR